MKNGIFICQKVSVKVLAKIMLLNVLRSLMENDTKNNILVRHP